MEKHGDGNYDDGIYYQFNKTSDYLHLSVQMYTLNPDVESCDIRLTANDINTTNATYFKKVDWYDTMFYRMGYFNY